MFCKRSKCKASTFLLSTVTARMCLFKPVIDPNNAANINIFYFYLSVLTPNNFKLAGSRFFSTTIQPRRVKKFRKSWDCTLVLKPDKQRPLDQGSRDFKPLLIARGLNLTTLQITQLVLVDLSGPPKDKNLSLLF